MLYSQIVNAIILKTLHSHRIFKLFMALVAILNSMSLLFFYQPVQNNDTKMVNDIIVR